MKYKVVSKTGELITLEDAKAHLRVTHDIEDDIIVGCIAAAIGWAEQYTGLALADYKIIAYSESNSLVYTINRFLPLNAVVAVKSALNQAISHSVQFPNIITIEQPLNSEDYPIAIEYTTSISNNVPFEVIAAIKLKISELYEFRTERQIAMTRAGQYRTSAENLLQFHKQDNFVL